MNVIMHFPIVLPVLLAGQNAWRVDECELFEHFTFHLRALEAIEESVAEFRERTKLLLRVHNQSVAGDYLNNTTSYHFVRTFPYRILIAVHDCYEAICGWFRPNTHAGEVSLE